MSISPLLKCAGLGVLAVSFTAAATGAMAHGKRHSPRKAPLVIEEQGSFFVGGEVLHRGDNDDVTIHQTYVQFQVPAGKKRVPIIFTHGCCLSSKTWETTPDGRMGWDEWFLRAGHPVYLTDQTGRGRSGFNATIYNQVAAGDVPGTSQPPITHVGHQSAWSIFRFGPSFGVPHSDGQFPIEAAGDLYKQMIPDLNRLLPEFYPIWPALADLSEQAGGAVVVGHSQSGLYPFHAAVLNPEYVKGVINIEAGGTCHENFGVSESGDPSPAAIATLAKIPMLMIYGDHLEGTSWQGVFEDCKLLTDEINAAGGNVTMIHLPEIGIKGNSHMLMQDKNSDKLAKLVDNWIKENVERPRHRGHHHAWWHR
jgi:pimeloyl-ACP methyl ester carboxylesterase